MSTTIGTVHTFGIHGHRAIGRTSGTLFNSNVIEHLAYSALRYRRDTEGPDARRFSFGLAGLDHSRHASA